MVTKENRGPSAHRVFKDQKETRVTPDCADHRANKGLRDVTVIHRERALTTLMV